MALEFQVDSLDTVDESLKSVYVEKDGKFNLDADKYAEFKATGLKNKNKELLGKLGKASDGLKKFEKFAEFDDSDLEELLELRANKDKPGEKPGDDERIAQLEKLHKKALDKITGEKGATETRAAELEKQVKHYQLTIPVRDAALKAGVLPEDLEVVMLDTQKRFGLNDEGKPVVLDEDGDPMDVSLDKFFSSLYKEQRPKFYAPSGAGGSGAPTNAGGGGSGKTMKMAAFQELGREQQKAFMAEVSAGKAKLID
jgi:hypothetical protein